MGAWEGQKRRQRTLCPIFSLALFDVLLFLGVVVLKALLLWSVCTELPKQRSVLPLLGLHATGAKAATSADCPSSTISTAWHDLAGASRSSLDRPRGHRGTLSPKNGQWTPQPRIWTCCDAPSTYFIHLNMKSTNSLNRLPPERRSAQLSHPEEPQSRDEQRRQV